jgi:hypothetical protein
MLLENNIIPIILDGRGALMIGYYLYVINNTLFKCRGPQPLDESLEA